MALPVHRHNAPLSPNARERGDVKPQHECDDNGRLIRNPQVGEWAGNSDEFRNKVREHHLRETGTVYEKEDARPINKSYFGQDRPAGKDLQARGAIQGTPNRIDAKAPAAIAMRDAGTHQFLVGNVRLQGQSPIRVNFNMISQFPGFQVHVNFAPDRWAICHIFVDNLYRLPGTDYVKAACGFTFGRNENMRARLDEAAPHDSELITLAERGALFALQFELVPVEPTASGTLRGPQEPRRPMITGISPDELQIFITAEPTQNTPEQRMLVGLAQGARRFEIYRLWQVGDEMALKHMSKWFGGAVQMTSNYGNLWGYSLQDTAEKSNESITDMGLDSMAKLEVPRHMISSWLFSRSKSTAPAASPRPLPRVVDHFPFPATIPVFPNSDVLAFCLCLGICREREAQMTIIEADHEPSTWDVLGNFMAPDKDRYPFLFRVTLRLFQGRLQRSHQKLRPVSGSLIRILVKTPDYEKSRKPLTFEGKIIDYHHPRFGFSDELTHAWVECIGSSVSDLEVVFPDHDFTSGAIIPCKFELVGDFTTAAAQFWAIRRIQRAFEWRRTEGVDLAAIILRAPPDATRRAGMLSAETSDIAIRDSLFKNIIAKSRRDETQTAACSMSLESISGLQLICGPSGVGKTSTLLTIAHLHVIFGRPQYGSRRRQILITASSDAAVGAILREHLALPTSSTVKIALAMGTQFHAAASSAPTVRPDPELLIDLRRLDEARCMEMMEQAGVEPIAPEVLYSYHYQRQTMAQRLADDDEGEDGLAQIAQDWLVITDRLVEMDKDTLQNTASDLYEQRDRLEVFLDERFLRHEIDIVICTNFVAAHDLLRKYFKPKIAMIDAAGSTSIPEAAVPLASFETIEHVILCGDPEQDQPVVTSAFTNEMANMLGRSVLGAVRDTARYADSEITLQVQKRMPLELTTLVKRVFSSNILLPDGVSTSGGDDSKWNTVQVVLSRLEDAWQGQRRVFFDIDGYKSICNDRGERDREQIASTLSPGCSSLYNEWEASKIVAFIYTVLHQLPPDNGSEVLASDFLVIASEARQVLEIQNKLNERRLSQPGNQVRVVTSRSIEGIQAPFVIYSHVRNNPKAPDDIGSAADQYALQAIFSRAQQAFFAFGNWKALLAQVALNREPFSLTKVGRASKLAQILRHAAEHNEFVDWRDFGRMNTRPLRPHASTTKRSAGEWVIPARTSIAKFMANAQRQRPADKRHGQDVQRR